MLFCLLYHGINRRDQFVQVMPTFCGLMQCSCRLYWNARWLKRYTCL